MSSRSDRSFTEKRAFSVFDKLLTTQIVPDAITFTSLLSAISRSRDPDAALRADTVFESMQKFGVVPDTRAWTIYLTIWSRSQQRNKEDVVHQLYEK